MSSGDFDFIAFIEEYGISLKPRGKYRNSNHYFRPEQGAEML